jgi:tricorn protease
VGVHPGDYILAVDGHPVGEMANIYAALVGTVGRQVSLTVNARPVTEGARDVTIVPIADEAPLYYYRWVRRNLDRVAERTGGKAGYIHIPDMETAGLNEFVKHFFPQLGKKALIIDDRGNAGGNVSPMIVERLRRQMAMIEISRNGQPVPNPSDLLNGPLVLIVNQYSASDGDIFPFRFRAYHLGPIVGVRTWGGVVGIREPLPLSDGGFVMKPEFAPYSKDGKDWIIEGHGIDPDIVVDNDPAQEFAGVDQQLERAIDEILLQLRTKGKSLPPPPPYPDRSHPNP